jgi:hypothetical protein
MGDLDDMFEVHQPQPTKRGRKSRVSDDDLFGNRNALIGFLENNWPEIVTLFKNPGAKETFVIVLKAHPLFLSDPAQRNWEREHILKHAEDLWNFLDSGRYHGDPRQIANALAGVPVLSWRRSLDRCSQIQVPMSIHLRAMRDYLRRKFPDRFRDLLNAHNAEDAQRVLKRARTDDDLVRRLQRNRELLWQALEEGNPRSA